MRTSESDAPFGREEGTSKQKLQPKEERRSPTSEAGTLKLSVKW